MTPPFTTRPAPGWPYVPPAPARRPGRPRASPCTAPTPVPPPISMPAPGGAAPPPRGRGRGGRGPREAAGDLGGWRVVVRRPPAGGGPRLDPPRREPEGPRPECGRYTRRPGADDEQVGLQPWSVPEAAGGAV